MSFHGGLLGVIVVMLWYARRLKINPGRLLDFVAPIAPLGLGMGRLGNFIGQELWGRPADIESVPWAMVFPADPDLIARNNTDEMLAHLASDMRHDQISRVQLNAKPRIGKGLGHRTFNF